MKKFRIFLSFSAVYYLTHSDKVCRNYGKNTFSAIFEIDLKPSGIRGNNTYKKVSHFLKLSNAISFAAFRRMVKKLARKYEIGGTCTIFKLFLNCSKLENFKHEKVAHFHKLSNAISFASIGLVV